MRALVAPVGGTLAVHLVLVLAVGRAPDARRGKRIVPVVVHDAPHPPARPPLPPPPPPPRPITRAHHVAKTIAAPSPVPPPSPPQGFSVDTHNTVAESTVAVAAKEGGGNAFADPAAGLPAGDKVSVRPPPPEAPRFQPAKWITDPRDRSPPYPGAALRNEIEGQVLLRVCVGPNGTVDSVQVVRGIGFGCDEAAASWAREHWRFQPALRGGAPVATCLLQPMRFQLQR